MADDRPARSRAGNSVEDAVRKSVDTVGALIAAGYKPGPFVKRGLPSGGDLRAAVRQRLGAPKPSAPNLPVFNRPSAPSAATPDPQGAWGVIKAGIRGVEDSLPFDLGDYAPSMIAAIKAGMRGYDPGPAFSQHLEAERGQNRYDEAVHPTARTVGEIAGEGAQLFAPGMALARVAEAKRMAEAASLIFKEARRLTAAGAAAGIGVQAAGDGLNGHVGSLGDYGGAAVGGGAGALAAIYGKGRYAGGVAGGAASLAGDLLNGRLGSSTDVLPTIERATRAAADGNLLSLPVGGALARRLDALSPRQKGILGEWLARQRTALRGKKVAAEQVRTRVSGGHTRVDHLEMNGDAVEAKFGNALHLSKRQKEAFRELSNYRVDHVMPRDVGSAIGVPSGLLPHMFIDDDDQ